MEKERSIIAQKINNEKYRKYKCNQKQIVQR